MRELVARDIPINREWMSYSGALEYFRSQGQTGHPAVAGAHERPPDRR
ncbi:MAG: hypothetical protein M0C28_22750 [Candidatus Moduliflexus flocculans]|nr:hypothetical protein [Candidatus Moduliflexus flocculans]